MTATLLGVKTAAKEMKTCVTFATSSPPPANDCSVAAAHEFDVNSPISSKRRPHSPSSLIQMPAHGSTSLNKFSNAAL